MGLLDDLPDSLLKLIRNATQNRNPNADPGADDTNDLPTWVPRGQQQRPPLSLAGPGLGANIATSSPSLDRFADPSRAQPPAPATQNLTIQALRMKGVPEADIAAATGNPQLMKQLIVQNYGPGSADAPPSTYRYKPNNPVQLNDPSGLLAGLGPGSSPSPPPGPSSPGQQAGITSDKSSYCRTMHNICIRQCDGILGGRDSFGPFRACIRTCMHNAGCFDF